MKNIRLEIMDSMGNLIKEKTIVLSDNARLIVKYPYEKYKIEHMKKMMEFIELLLEGKRKFICLPEDIKLEVVEVE